MITSACSPWATTADMCAPCNTYALDEAVLADALDLATFVLFNFTGRQWPGECTDIIRPCGYRSPVGWGRPAGYAPATKPDVPLIGWCGCSNRRACGCGGLSEIRLPGYPVVGVEQVKIDGEVVDPARYRVDDYRWLVYLPDPDDPTGRQSWPCCQRVDLADTEPDTWSIIYKFGTAPPAGAPAATAALACEFAKSCSPDEDINRTCRFPKRVTSIVRAGVAMAVLDPLTLFDDEKTGLSEVDLWVAGVKAGRRNRRGTVWHPTMARSSRRTTG